jgi:hypothetical protein
VFATATVVRGQPRAEVLLQLSEGPGERRLGEVQPGRGTREGARVGDGEERPEVPQLDGHA